MVADFEAVAWRVGGALLARHMDLQGKNDFLGVKMQRGRMAGPDEGGEKGSLL